MNVDLPNLVSINIKRYSFCNPRSVTLESSSNSNMMVFRYSKSSNGWTFWFIPVCWIKINFEYWLIHFISFIDVSSILSDFVQIKLEIILLYLLCNSHCIVTFRFFTMWYQRITNHEFIHLMIIETNLMCVWFLMIAIICNIHLFY